MPKEQVDDAEIPAGAAPVNIAAAVSGQKKSLPKAGLIGAVLFTVAGGLAAAFAVRPRAAVKALGRHSRAASEKRETPPTARYTAKHAPRRGAKR